MTELNDMSKEYYFIIPNKTGTPWYELAKGPYGLHATLRGNANTLP